METDNTLLVKIAAAQIVIGGIIDMFNKEQLTLLQNKIEERSIANFYPTQLDGHTKQKVLSEAWKMLGVDNP